VAAPSCEQPRSIDPSAAATRYRGGGSLSPQPSVALADSHRSTRFSSQLPNSDVYLRYVAAGHTSPTLRSRDSCSPLDHVGLIMRGKLSRGTVSANFST
jgi:hypothetical protein